MSLFEDHDSPQQIMDRIYGYAAAGRQDEIVEAGTEVNGKLRMVGTYDDKMYGYYMLRIRVPGGLMDSAQARVIGQYTADHCERPPEYSADIPEKFAEVTTRQDIQLHWMRIEDLPVIWDLFKPVGLTSLMACGDTTRNITGCPVAGIDKHEVVDVSPLLLSINQYMVEHAECSSFLPRKFKISLTGCREDCILAGVNDIAFRPAIKDSVGGFHVRIGGGLSDYPRLASDMGIFVTEDQVLEVVKSCLDVYKTFGNFNTKAVNRFRRVVAELGEERTIEEMLNRLPFEPATGGESMTDSSRHDHVGVHPQKQDGYSYVGLNVQVGRIPGKDLVELADLADEYGDGGLRCTPRQNLVMTGVPNGRVDELLKESILQTYSPTPKTFNRSVVSCTSSPFCKFAILNVKKEGREMADFLDEALGDGDYGPIRLHISGCKASCAQPQIADIGLRANACKDESGMYPAFDVATGGSLKDDELAKWVALEVPVPVVQQGIKQLLTDYKANRNNGQTFGEYVRERGPEALRDYFEKVKV